jgi:hypothetical protein
VSVRPRPESAPLAPRLSPSRRHPDQFRRPLRPLRPPERGRPDAVAHGLLDPGRSAGRVPRAGSPSRPARSPGDRAPTVGPEGLGKPAAPPAPRETWVRAARFPLPAGIRVPGNGAPIPPGPGCGGPGLGPGPGPCWCGGPAQTPWISGWLRSRVAIPAVGRGRRPASVDTPRSPRPASPLRLGARAVGTGNGVPGAGMAQKTHPARHGRQAPSGSPPAAVSNCRPSSWRPEISGRNDRFLALLIVMFLSHRSSFAGGVRSPVGFATT